MKMDNQPYPTTGRLASDMNLDLANLKSKIRIDQANAYYYVIATIKNSNGHFLQTGSAPNFQGDLVSLCTCKHLMRTYMDTEEWVGKWIAGFSGVTAGNGKNMLVYLMKVGYAFKSHQSLWFSTKIPEEAKVAKLAKFNKFGDIYQPFDQNRDPFSFQSYFEPVKNHVHCNNNHWHNDINYDGCKGRKATLLVGDIDNSFLWNMPKIYLNDRLHRGQKKGNIRTLLLEQLSEQIK